MCSKRQNAEECAWGLQVKSGICLVRLDQLPNAELYFNALLEESVEEFADLYTQVADALLEMGFPDQVCLLEGCNRT